LLLLQVYASRIASLETQVLLDKRPPARLTKELHLLCNDLKGITPQWQLYTCCYVFLYISLCFSGLGVVVLCLGFDCRRVAHAMLCLTKELHLLCNDFKGEL
jgi:hypothetical protein